MCTQGYICYGGCQCIAIQALPSGKSNGSYSTGPSCSICCCFARGPWTLPSVIAFAFKAYIYTHTHTYAQWLMAYTYTQVGWNMTEDVREAYLSYHLLLASLTHLPTCSPPLHVPLQYTQCSEQGSNLISQKETKLCCHCPMASIPEITYRLLVLDFLVSQSIGQQLLL